MGVIALAMARAVAGDIVINEIHYDPADETSLEEFVELHNTGESATDLGGAYFDDGISFAFPAGTMIAAHGYLVVAQDPATVQARFGAAALGPYSGILKNSGERVRLRDASGATLDEVTYSDHFPWPPQAGGGGSSMELLHPGLDNDLGASWRSSNVPDTPTTPSVFLPAGSSAWKYRKGTSEPPSDWRETNFTMDATWLTGTTSIGYGDNDDATILADMEDDYSTIYLRHQFTVDGAEQIQGPGTLNHYLDDGAIISINGVELTRINVGAGDKAYDDLSGAAAVNNASWKTYDIANLADVLVVGTNTLAVHMLNSTLSSSDLSVDFELKTADAENPLPEPTPGAPNSCLVASASAAPPAMRQVGHIQSSDHPKQILSNQPVTVTAKVTDPDGMAAVTLLYQIVEPGAYLPAFIAWTPTELKADPHRPPLPNPDFEDPANWTETAMHDDGLDGDTVAGDSIFTVVLPASLQVHRRLIRYRIRAEDTGGASVRVPHAGDPSLNFAYFCYDGEPAWSGAIHPGDGGPEGTVATYGADVMRSMPTYHLLSKNREVEWCQWYDLGRTTSIPASIYNWQGTFVYDGEVYDHIRYRIRGWSHPYNEGKNKWKFDFNRGRPFQARDNKGKEYPKAWDKLNFLSGYSHRIGGAHPGEEGMIVAANSKLFNLVGVPCPATQFVQFRVIDDAVETSPSSQYDGDFWGLYLAMEQPDGRFLDAHDLPDGNLYKMNGDGTSKNNQGPAHPGDWSDLDTVEAALNAGPSASWFHSNTEMDCYYGYRSIIEAVHHFDLNVRSNHLMFHHPLTDRWWMLPWDFDLSWSSNIYSNDRERYKQSLGDTDIDIAFKNRAREIRDLLFNADQGAVLVDRLDSKSADPAIPATPTIQYTGLAGHPLGGLSFQCSAFSDPQGAGTFAAMQWRAGEILDPAAPAYDPAAPAPYEITEKWGTGEVAAYSSDIAIPSTALKVGRAYRVRVRMKDSTDRWSHWSAPVEFVVGEPDVDVWKNNLVVSEIMYNPPAPTTPEEIAVSTDNNDFEFVELLNVSDVLTLDLADIRFTKGVDFDFAGSAVTSLGPGEYVLVVKSRAAFEARYGTGLPVAGEFAGTKLSNGGEQLKLSYGSGVAIRDFIYDDAAPWPAEADGSGASLVLRDPVSVPDHSLPENWTAGTAATPAAPEPAEGTYAKWRQSHFSPFESRDPDVSGPDADPDGDGRTNHFERAFATDPWKSDTPLNEIVWVTEDNDDFPGVRIRRPENATDLAYQLESSTDLENWHPASATVVVEASLGDGTEQVVLRDNLPDAAGISRRFLRVCATQAP